MTGITRVSKESIFSDLNNLNVITSTSQEYETSFGFTEEEVFYVRSHGPLPSHWERIREPSSLQCSLYCRSFIHFINSSIFINMTGLSYEMLCAAALFFCAKREGKDRENCKRRDYRFALTD